MKTTLIALLAFAGALFGQYKAESGSPVPAEIAAKYKELPFQTTGIKVVDDKGKAYCEVWLVGAEPPATKSTEENITFSEIAHGSLLGIIHFPNGGEDRRGQKIKPGHYSLRYSNFPINGDHQGAAPQRDFFVLSNVADDTSSKPIDYKPLMDLSIKANGAPHPLVLSIWKADAPKDGFAKEGDHDWVLQKNIGKLPFAIILIGKAEG